MAVHLISVLAWDGDQPKIISRMMEDVDFPVDPETARDFRAPQLAIPARPSSFCVIAEINMPVAGAPGPVLAVQDQTARAA